MIIMSDLSVVQGMAAAGLEIRLPSEIAALASFAECLGPLVGVPREIVQQHLPHFLFDAWPLAL